MDWSTIYPLQEPEIQTPKPIQTTNSGLPKQMQPQHNNNTNFIISKTVNHGDVLNSTVPQLVRVALGLALVFCFFLGLPLPLEAPPAFSPRVPRAEARVASSMARGHGAWRAISSLPNSTAAASSSEGKTPGADPGVVRRAPIFRPEGLILGLGFPRIQPQLLLARDEKWNDPYKLDPFRKPGRSWP